MKNQEFRIFTKFGDINGTPEEGGTPIIHLTADTDDGAQAWVLRAGDSVSEVLCGKTVPFAAACMSGGAEYYSAAGIPVGLAGESGGDLVLGAAPQSHFAPKESGGLTFRLGGGIDTDPAEARKLMRLMRKERAARFIKNCENRGTDGFFVTVSEEDAPLFCVECDKEDIDCRLVEDIPHSVCPQTDDNEPGGTERARPWEDAALSAAERLLLLVSSRCFCSKQGFYELFDTTVGAGSVLAPHGGMSAAAPEQAAAILIPAPNSRTACVIACAQGEDRTSCAVISAAKLTASGCAPCDIFSYLRNGIGFAVAATPASRVLPSHFVRRGSLIYLLEAPKAPDGTTDFAGLRQRWEALHELILRGDVLSAYACEAGGAVGALAHMSLSGLSACVEPETYDSGFFSVPDGSIVFESPRHIEGERVIGVVRQKPEVQLGNDYIPLQSLYTAWWQPLEAVYPTEVFMENTPAPALEHSRRAPSPVHLLSATPLALAPVFPGTVSEDAMAAALNLAGAAAEMPLIRTLRPDRLEASADAIEKAMKKTQMLILHGNGDFIAEFFRRTQLDDALRDLIDRRGGLVLGICGGFEALVKLGLLPGTLTANAIGTRRSRYINTRVSSVLSPWLMRCATGEIHVLPISCTTGRYKISADQAEALISSGQMAFQYCDARGTPSLSTFVNPTGSALAVEGVTSPDGRILGKTAHPERSGFYIGKNIPGNKQQPIFEGGVRYFR